MGIQRIAATLVRIHEFVDVELIVGMMFGAAWSLFIFVIVSQAVALHSFLFYSLLNSSGIYPIWTIVDHFAWFINSIYPVMTFLFEERRHKDIKWK